MSEQDIKALSERMEAAGSESFIDYALSLEAQLARCREAIRLVLIQRVTHCAGDELLRAALAESGIPKETNG